MVSCRRCDEPIIFDDYHTSDSGKKIPLDADTGEPHQCSNWQPRELQPVECYKCGNMITFHPSQKSKSGRLIPLNWTGRRPHQCPDDKEDEYDEAV